MSSIANCDKLFSEYIRKRDTPGKCISCQRVITFDTADAGHFMSRSHMATRYHDLNVNAQCKKCNRFEHGRQYEHARGIDEKYGEGVAEELYKLSKTTVKYSKNDLKELAKELRHKIKEL